MYPNQRVSTEALYAAAALNLPATPVPAFARVMEIGCGSATSLIMHAWLTRRV